MPRGRQPRNPEMANQSVEEQLAQQIGNTVPSSSASEARPTYDLYESPVVEAPKFHVSLGTKVNIGNYENIDISMGLSGIPVDSSPEYIESVTVQASGKITDIMNALYAELADKIQKVKEAYGIE